VHLPVRRPVRGPAGQHGNGKAPVLLHPATWNANAWSLGSLSSSCRLHCRTTADCGSTAGCRQRPRTERRQRKPALLSPQMSGPSSEAAVSHIRASAVGVDDSPQCRGQRSEVAVVDTTVLQLAGQLAEKRRPVPSGGDDWHADLDLTLDYLHSRPPGGRRAALLPRAASTADRTPLRDGPSRPRRDGTAAPGAGRRCSAPSTAVRRGARQHAGSPGRIGGSSLRGLLPTLSFSVTPTGSALSASSWCHAPSVIGDLR
jgi:hypothetical protein